MNSNAFQKICKATLESHGLVVQKPVAEGHVLWDAQFFEIEKTTLFKSLTSSQQHRLLKHLSSQVLQEAYWIEKSGMTFSAKMNLLSKSEEEKMVYCFIGAEEALHLKSLEPFLSVDDREMKPFFAGLIDDWISRLDRPSLLMLIQILLEGWGLFYYKTLANKTLNDGLKKVLGNILLDEARHHATGVTLYRKEVLTKEQRENLIRELELLFFNVQVGPQAVVMELCKTKTDTQSQDFEKLFNQMGAEQSVNVKLLKLQQILEKSWDSEILEACQKKGLFTAHSIDSMAQTAQDHWSLMFQNKPMHSNPGSELSL